MVWSRRASSPSSSDATRRVRGLDLALEQVVLVEQQADLEGDLGVELGHRDRVGRGGLQSLGLRLAQPPVTGSGVGVGQRRRPSAPARPPRSARCAAPPGRSGRSGSSNSSPSSGKPSSTSRMRRWQTFACSLTSVIAKRAAWRSSTPGERIAGRGRVTHGHLGEAPGIGRVGLRATQPALRKVLRRERVDEGHRDRPPAQVRGERHPVVARRLHRHEGHRLGLPVEPGVEGREPRPVSGSPAGSRGRPGLAVPAAGHHVRPSPDVDPDRRHPGASLSDHPGVPARSGRRQLMGPITGHRRRIPITVHGRRSGAGH